MKKQHTEAHADRVRLLLTSDQLQRFDLAFEELVEFMETKKRKTDD
jgi:hypothetical protein